VTAAEGVRPPAPHGASPEGPVGGATGAFEFLPKDFDLKRSAFEAVKKHPIPCLLGAAAVGFWIGRHRGKAVAIAIAGYATNLMVREMNRAFDTSEF
jgi:hypothetical protein